MAKTEVSCGDLDAYIDVNIIAVRTKAVSGLIFYPFIILFLMIISRTNYFARWDWPYSIIIIFGLNSALALYAVWSLRNATEKLRSASLAKLKKRLLEALSHPEGERVARLKFLIEETEGCDEGAFAPISQQPLIKALLMPFGGAGVLTLVDYFTNR